MLKKIITATCICYCVLRWIDTASAQKQIITPNRISQNKTIAPEPSEPFRIIGYISGGRYSNEREALAAHIDSLTDINFAFINPTNDGSGNITPLSEQQIASLKHIVAVAKKHERRVLLSFGGWRGDDLGVDEPYERIVGSDLTRQHFIKEIIQLVEKYDVDGVDIDWEYPRVDTAERKYATEYATFIHELATALHENDKVLTAAVIGIEDKSTDDGNGAAYLDSVLQDLDLVNLMAYDASDTDHSSYELAEESLRYWIDQRGLEPGKAVLGLPLYARPGWIDYNKIIATVGPDQSQQDSYVNAKTGITGFYNGQPTIRRKTQLALSRKLAGVMFWEIPLDTFGESAQHSLIKTAHDTVNDLGK